MQKKSKFIDDILFEIVTNYSDYIKLKNDEVKSKHDKILGEYFQLEEEIIVKNSIMLKACYYCGLAISKMAMNTPCVVNKSVKFERDGYTVEKPQPGHYGTKRHFWSASSMQSRNKQNLVKFGGHNAETIFMNSLKRLRLSLAQLYSHITSN